MFKKKENVIKIEMKKYRLILMMICLMCFKTSANSQIIPSIYCGWGLGTNLGGEIGIGSELKYKQVSFSGAIGSWIGSFPEHSGDKSRFDYDFGLKLYSKIGLYIGLNYGVIDEALYTKANYINLYFEKTHGFSYTLGYKHSIYKNIYGLGFVGLTSNNKVNYLELFNKKEFIPRLGLLIGYEFN